LQRSLWVQRCRVLNSVCRFPAQVFPPLVVGAKLVIASPRGHLDPDYMADLICSSAATNLGAMVPTLMREWVAALGDRRPEAMRTWGLGGENVSLADVALMQKMFPNLRGPINSYGEFLSVVGGAALGCQGGSG
jgi:non-ribosomal peptide synthetase component F